MSVRQIDCYDYERLEFVLRLLSDVTPGDSGTTQQLRLLKCIKSYKRVAPPSAYEVSYRAASDSDIVR